MERSLLAFYLLVLIVALPSALCAEPIDKSIKEKLFSENIELHDGRLRKITNLDMFTLKGIESPLLTTQKYFMYLIYSITENKVSYLDCWSYRDKKPFSMWQLMITSDTFTGRYDEVITAQVRDYNMTFVEEDEYRRFLKIFLPDEEKNKTE